MPYASPTLVRPDFCSYYVQVRTGSNQMDPKRECEWGVRHTGTSEILNPFMTLPNSYMSCGTMLTTALPLAKGHWY